MEAAATCNMLLRCGQVFGDDVHMRKLILMYLFFILGHSSSAQGMVVSGIMSTPSMGATLS